MKALVLEEPSATPRLTMREVPLPSLGVEDVLVKVRACGLCYHDILVMQGILRRGVKPQVVLGHEISGEVVEVGARVSTLKPGDRVTSILTDACGACERCLDRGEHRCLHGRGIGHSTDGGFAEYIALRQFSVVPLPPDVDLEGACLLGCPIGVVVRAITEVASVQPGETVLVTGASGGLGAHAVQVARAAGARVLAVTSIEEKVSRIQALGADEVVCSDELDFSEVVLALTQDRGVDVVLDTVGSPTFRSAFHSLAQYGRLVVLGEVAGAEMPMNLAEIIFRDARILGSSGASRKNVETAGELMSQGKIKPIITERFSLEQGLEAYQHMLERRHFGRLMLMP